MKKIKLPLICILALTGCKIEIRKAAWDWCIEEIKKVEGYSSLDSVEIENISPESPPLYNYMITTTTQDKEENLTCITSWDCKISFEDIKARYSKSEIQYITINVFTCTYWAN